MTHLGLHGVYIHIHSNMIWGDELILPIILYETTLDRSWHLASTAMTKTQRYLFGSQFAKCLSNLFISPGPPTPALTKQVWEV